MQTHKVKCPSGVIISVDIDRNDPETIRVNVTGFNSMSSEDRVFMLKWFSKMLPLADPTAQMIFTKDGTDPIVMSAIPVLVLTVEDNSQECTCENCVRDRKMAEKASFN